MNYFPLVTEKKNWPFPKGLRHLTRLKAMTEKLGLRPNLNYSH